MRLSSGLLLAHALTSAVAEKADSMWFDLLMLSYLSRYNALHV